MTPSSWRRRCADSPFAILGLIALAIMVLGAMPAGYDYDPDPFRSTLRRFDLVAVPYFAAGALFHGIGITSPLATPLWFLLGWGPYLALDVAWRAFRRRLSQPPANEES